MELNELLVRLTEEIDTQLEDGKKVIKIPNVKEGVGCEIEQDPKTAKKTLHYFTIENGVAKYVGDRSGTQNAPQIISNKAGKDDRLFYKALEVISSKSGNKLAKRFMIPNIERIDIIGHHTDGVFNIIATSDDGQLQMQFDTTMEKWIKKQGK